MAGSYYAARAARDPAWREAQLRGAAEREARRREENPDAFREARRQATARCRERQARHGLTLHELQARVGRRTGSGPETLAAILAEEVRRGRVDYHSTTRRYVLNGGLDLETRQALLALEPLHPAGTDARARAAS